MKKSTSIAMQDSNNKEGVPDESIFTPLDSAGATNNFNLKIDAGESKKRKQDEGDKLKRPQKWDTWLNLLRNKSIPVPDERNVVSREYKAGLFSLLAFNWISPLMTVGYNRTLEVNDIWLVNPDRSTEMLAERLKDAYARRFLKGDRHPLIGAIVDTFRMDCFVGALGSLTTSIIQVLMPFVLKYLIAFATDAYYATQTGSPAPYIGQGIGYVIGITVMQIIASIANNHFMYRGMILGGQVRSVLIALIFDKAMRISGRAKAGGIQVDRPPSGIEPGTEAEKQWYAHKLKSEAEEKFPNSVHSPNENSAKKKSRKENLNTSDGVGWSNGRIINLMSTDASRIDHACGFIHMAWTSPIAILVTLALLLVNLTYSALAGFGIFFVSMPLVALYMGSLFKQRANINKITDRRIILTHEILQAIRFIKYYSWEESFLSRVADVRHLEIRSIQIFLSSLNVITSVGISLPVFASMLAFVTYSLTQHNLEPASVFSSLALFNGLRMPVTYLPLIVGQIIDALASVSRIEAFLQAEERHDKCNWENENVDAVVLSEADFTWERNHSRDISEGSKEGSKDKIQANTVKDATKPAKEITNSSAKASKKLKNSKVLEFQPTPKTKDIEPFKLEGVNVTLGRKELVAVIGSVGSGKSSLLSAIAGDMRQSKGSMTLGASRAFCPQQAWIQNTTVQENITFGKNYDRIRFDQIIDACALRSDLEMLPYGRMTEIGERGINLSGGQKQRINIARAIYVDADIVLLDDPLSAVDAPVGHHIMNEAICGLLKEKCRILATHQLHILSRCDRIILMEEGKISAFDTFDNLLADNAVFRRLLSTVDTIQKETENINAEEKLYQVEKIGITLAQDNLMETEDQAVNAIPWSVYDAFFKDTGTVFSGPLVLFLLTLSQGSNIVTGLWLAWWTSDNFKMEQGVYIGIYVGLGFIQIGLMFFYSMSISIFCTWASQKMHSRAVRRVLRSPMSFFDTTPIGRIMNRFSKDVEVMDNVISDSIRMGLITLGSVISVFILIVVYFPFFGIALVPIFILYGLLASYYRSSAREIKRHEAVLRSAVYARFNEAISGTATLRAYDLQDYFYKTICHTIDDMDSAYYLSFANQRWLGLRLDAVGVIVIFVCGLLVVTSRFSVPPSIGGLVLSYMIAAIQMLQFSVRQMAEIETNLNSTERLHYYGTKLVEEAPSHIIDFSTRQSWPERGEIHFEHVNMRYRPGLPLVLEDFTLKVNPGERMAIVGRTGAGKSSIMSTLFRLVEICSGSITIDGVDVSKIGLHDLRTRMSIIPQDPTLFRGTIRSNIDPFNEHTDLELWSALRQSDLVGVDTALGDRQDRIHLDGAVEDDGSNFSLGQRQLLALARALVRGSQIIVCDEATSSIDFETDQRVQKTIFEGFKGKTLLCIAHRLKTIIGYDRVCVIEQGKVAELGTPLELFEYGRTFRAMCEKNSIERQAIINALHHRYE